ncbi:transcriptional regulator GlxA family with amidase domain [Pseudomonas sp. BIGb0408]|uniref:Transcriptional regulator GlxA family with amidase domain n=1 Tax=Phytopseudomonas flavescens TaxID=29435 RepID=A0A7Z0BMX9_9GAMM|nr:MULTISPECIES: GlxA family transcriptional regulator [Pseudomonas]MCW2293139.1 transcriptional regulator GlxA family with amidase domain [Pseudomonas sp. BIGb0408]NYH72290.1 transcriptional regulator GlxA family with amidase domain [Pseudomonas flavescens]
MKNIALYVCPEFLLLDLAGPLAAFEAASLVAGRPLYSLAVTSAEGGSVFNSSGIAMETVSFNAISAETVIFIGGRLEPMFEPAQICAASAHASGATRVASVCTGTFLLAETGLLDGRRATTHWKAVPLFLERYPSVKMQPDLIYVMDGNAWTSGGVTAGIDLALALIEADHGVEMAQSVARHLVVYHRRTGGQSQFSELSKMEPASDRIRRSLTFAREHLAEALPIERLAEAANLSVRQFGRAFRQETGETPAKAVERLRVEAARLRLREGSEPIEKIAISVGFIDPERMRRAFIKLHGMSPQTVRRVER